MMLLHGSIQEYLQGLHGLTPRAGDISKDFENEAQRLCFMFCKPISGFTNIYAVYSFSACIARNPSEFLAFRGFSDEYSRHTGNNLRCLPPQMPTQVIRLTHKKHMYKQKDAKKRTIVFEIVRFFIFRCNQKISERVCHCARLFINHDVKIVINSHIAKSVNKIPVLLTETQCLQGFFYDCG